MNEFEEYLKTKHIEDDIYLIDKHLADCCEYDLREAFYIERLDLREIWYHQQEKINRLETIVSGYSDKGFWGRAASRLQTQNITLQEENKRLWKELESHHNNAYCELGICDERLCEKLSKPT